METKTIFKNIRGSIHRKLIVQIYQCRSQLFFKKHCSTFVFNLVYVGLSTKFMVNRPILQSKEYFSLPNIYLPKPLSQMVSYKLKN